MAKAFFYEKANDAIGILYFDLEGEKINKFNSEVMQDLSDKLDFLEKQNDIKCLLLMSKKPGIFIAGADVNEIIKITDEQEGYNVARQGQKIFSRFENLPFPTVAVIDGACMGGGTELSLACTYRMASDNPKTKIGLPEVTLGILPGWGGTQRMPRLIGIQKSLDLILSGRRLDGRRAFRYGLVDKLIPAEWLMEKALDFGEEIVAGKTRKYIERRKPKGLPAKFLEKTAPGRKIMFSQAKKMVLKQSGGHYPAPLKALETIKRTHKKSLQKGLEIEARALGQLIPTAISKNLVQIYLWTEEIKRETGVAKAETATAEINKAAVLGAGVMGGGIAQLFASKDIPVRVKDINSEAVAKAYQQAAGVLKKQVKRRRIKKAEYNQIMNRISGTTDYSGFNSTQLVIEAIVEDINIKKTVLSELEKQVPENTIIATNTSSLLVDEMAGAVKKKKRFIGMHFFNPVHRMPLVEIIRAKKTSDEAVATLFALTKKLGKTPIVVNDGPGFLVNRLLVPYMVEAISLLEEGNGIQEIDRAMRKFGMPMGPLELFDEVGIDVALKVARILQKSMGERMAESDLLDRMVQEKRLGKKNNVGFYRYEGHKKIYDSSVEKLVTVKPQKKTSAPDMVHRMVYPMINEAARCLEEGIVGNPRDVDVGMIFGTGFAPFRGGLLKYADSEGLETVIEKLNAFEQANGARFKAAESLLKIQKSQKGFYS